MYSDKKSILQLAALLLEHGIERIVLCPGSRNTPLVQVFSTHSRFRCFAVTDERSAGFFALGLIQTDHKPVAVCCTSGSAVANLYPAVAEAFYQQLPLIVISADRPQQWIGQADGQTIPQPGIFGPLVRKAVHLPEVNTAEDEWYCNRLINEALLAVSYKTAAPVHINVPLSEPLFQYTVEALPQPRVIHRFSDLDSLLKGIGHDFHSPKKCLLLCGQMPPKTLSSRLIEALSEKGVVCLSEHLGNCQAVGMIGYFDAWLEALDKDKQQALHPDLLITIGGHIVSKRLKQWLRGATIPQHWHLALDGALTDTYCSLSALIETEPEGFLQQFLNSSILCCREYASLWHPSESLTPCFSYSAMAAVGALCKVLPEGCVLHLANSSAVRYAQLFELPSSVEVFCNRGTNGIEGSLSTAVGFASADSRPNFVLIGDLSFFYDLNALWNTHLPSNLRILLLNNGGGEIFQTLPGVDTSKEVRRFVVGEHTTSAQAWVQDRGMDYRRVHNWEELTSALSFLVQEKTCRSVLVEVFTNPQKDVQQLKEFYRNLKVRN